MVLSDDLLNPADLLPRKAAAAVQPDRVKPELRGVVIPLNVHVRRFFPVAGIEEETLGTDAQDRWHLHLTDRAASRSVTVAKGESPRTPQPAGLDHMDYPRRVQRSPPCAARHSPAAQTPQFSPRPTTIRASMKLRMK